jgi:tetratricopeptide (TPR) repeat protein
MLASLTTKSEEKLKLLRQAVAAGERYAGEEAFTHDVGHFWGILETRPYMRARYRLGEALWHSGDQQQALSHYQDMLRLNPCDNQGIRYTLIA